MLKEILLICVPLVLSKQFCDAKKMHLNPKVVISVDLFGLP